MDVDVDVFGGCLFVSRQVIDLQNNERKHGDGRRQGQRAHDFWSYRQQRRADDGVQPALVSVRSISQSTRSRNAAIRALEGSKAAYAQQKRPGPWTLALSTI